MGEEPEHITVCDGKYTLVMDPTNMRALRYGEEWRDLVGDGFVMALGHEISALRRLVLAITRRTEADCISERFIEDTNLPTVIDKDLGELLRSLHIPPNKDPA